MNIGSKVKYFVNQMQYLKGEIVELCENETAWVRFSNGQEINLSINSLVEVNINEKEMKNKFGMDEDLFLKLAFAKAYEIEFGTDEYLVMDNLDYGKDEKYFSLQDVTEDDDICKKIDEYAGKIRELIKELN